MTNTYRIRCEPWIDMSGIRPKKRGCDRDAPLSADLARRGHIVCMCGEEWPFAKLVTIWPDASASSIPPPPAAEPSPPPQEAPPVQSHSAKLRAKLAQGNLF